MFFRSLAYMGMLPLPITYGKLPSFSVSGANSSPLHAVKWAWRHLRLVGAIMRQIYNLFVLVPR